MVGWRQEPQTAIMSRFPEHPLPRFVFAVACTGLATVLALLLRTWFDHGILSFFLLAVLASAWVGGLGPGLLATALSVLSSDYFFLAPTHSLVIHSADDVAEIAVFSLVAVTISVLQTAQKKAKGALQALNEKLEDRVKERTSWLSLVYDITGAANEKETVDQAFQFALLRLTADGPWVFCEICTPTPGDMQKLSPSYLRSASDDAGLLRLQDLAPAHRVSKGQGPVGRVWSSGSLEWVADVAREPEYAARGFPETGLKSAVVFPVVIGRKGVAAVVECFSRERLERDEHLTNLMGAVGIELGLIVERKQLQEGYTEAVWQQQRQTAQELHDGLGQSLTGLWLLATSLSDKTKDADQVKLARKLTDGLEQSLEQIRGIAKGVFPVDLDAKGLMVALKELVETTASRSGISCRFECPDPVILQDNRVALHLYRIAQEAVTNAVKHGQPREIVVSLRPTEEGLLLGIADDGAGIPAPEERKEGAGLRIMKYRAAAVDAILRVDRNGGRGTLVTCRCPRTTRG